MSTYIMGSIFSVEYSTENDIVTRNILIVKINSNKFCFIDMETGNRWVDKLVYEESNSLSESKIINALSDINKNVKLERVNLIKHLAELDIYR